MSPAAPRYGLPKARRLLRPQEFTAVVRRGARARSRNFTVYAAPNEASHARLGIVVARRVSAKAVVRNRIKRRIRESFRLNHDRLAGLDIVVSAHPDAARNDAARLRDTLDQLWEKVAVQCRRS